MLSQLQNIFIYIFSYREIGRIDPQDFARDTSGTRSYALFLVELAEKVPAVMLASISVLVCHLDEEVWGSCSV